MDNNETICHCMDVTRGTIIEAIKKHNLKTVEEVGQATEAGTGCGGCQPVIQEILDEINK
jgi:NAD(P)H-nitrite reductase large subunit